MAQATGLRERKKQRTREAIVDAALRLFAERGFEATTIADIAAEADIAPRTFFGYFRSKEDVVFDDFDARSQSLEARLRDREPGESAVDALRAWVAALLAETDFQDQCEVRRRRVVAANPALAAHERELMARFEALVAAAVAADLGNAPEDLRPSMVAAAATAALLRMEAFYDDDPPDVNVDPMAHVDEAMTFLRGGIAALQDATPGPATPPPSATPARGR